MNAHDASPSGCCAHDLTIVVTTSPIPSMPSTALLQALLKSFENVHDLSGCLVIIVCDGIGTVLRADEKPNWKCSRVNAEHVTAYQEYTANVERLAKCQQQRCEVMVLQERHGCGLAVEAALALVKTPFVMVAQHDQLFLRNFDAGGVLAAMRAQPAALRYVGIQSRTTLRYKERVADRFGIALDRFDATPDLPLLPLLMYYDKPHIVWTEHLHERVYVPGVLKPGDFVEDVLGRPQLEDIKTNGIDSHGKYGTWVLCDDDEVPATYHLSGRKVVADAGGPSQEEKALIAERLVSETEATMWTANRVSIHADVPGLAAAAPSVPAAAATAGGKFKGVCYRCQAKGHSFRFCPLATLDSDRNSDDAGGAALSSAVAVAVSISEPSLAGPPTLDNEGVSHVFSFLKVDQLGACAATCSQWAAVVRDDGLLWRSLFTRDFEGHVTATEARRAYQRCIVTMRTLDLRQLPDDPGLSPRAGSAAGMIGRHALIVGGATTGFQFTNTADVWCSTTQRALVSFGTPEADPALSFVNQGRWQQSAVQWDDKLFCYGGLEEGGCVSGLLHILYIRGEPWSSLEHPRRLLRNFPSEATRVANWLVLLQRHEDDASVPATSASRYLLNSHQGPALCGHTACAVGSGQIHVDGSTAVADMPYMLCFGGKGLNKAITNLLWCVELREGSFSPARDAIISQRIPGDADPNEAQLPQTLRWRLLQAAGTAPAPRYCHSAVQSTCGWLQFGGWAEGGRRQRGQLNEGTVFLNDLHLLELPSMTWTALTTSGSVPRGRCQAVMMLSSDEEIVMTFGGACHSDPQPGQAYGDMVQDLCDVALLHLPTLTWLPAQGLPRHTVQRGGTNALIRTADSRCFIFGGMQSDPGEDQPKFLSTMTEVLGLDS